MQTMNAPVTLVEGGWGSHGGDRGANFTSPKRGTKRDASESKLSDWERFEKRLRTLSIQKEQTPFQKSRKPRRSSNISKQSPPSPTSTNAQLSERERVESMHIDDTPNRVYISDLDAELSSSDDDSSSSSSSGEDRLIFLPDIDKRFSRIPQQVLTGQRHHLDEDEGESRDLVLYSVPKSLTAVDEGHDSVRKAILESRQRARERSAQNLIQSSTVQSLADVVLHTEPNGSWINGFETDPGIAHDYDPDAMDLG